MAKTPSALNEAILEMAEDQHRLGIMDDATYRKITIRNIGKDSLQTAKPISAAEIQRIRESAHRIRIAVASMPEPT